MEKDDKKQKSIKDINLAPSKGVRRPGAARQQTNVSPGKNSFQKATTAGQKSKAKYSTITENDDLTIKVSSRPAPKAEKASAGVSSQKETSKISLRKRKNWNTRIKNTSSAPKILIAVILLISVVFLSSFVSYTYLVDKYNNPINLDSIYIDPDTSVSFKIERGNSTADIAKSLAEQDLIGSKAIYRFLSKFNGYDGSYKAGTYTLCKGLSYEEIMVILSSNPESVKITIPEGFTTVQIAARLEANKICSSSDFLNAVKSTDLSSYAFVKNYEKRDYRLDGYLFPDTYEFEIDSTPESVIYKMLNRFNEMYKPDYFNKAAEIGLTQDQVIILASLVEKEAKLPSERAKIAGVFMNRLHSDSLKKMQSCATIRYVFQKKYYETLDVVTKANTEEEDPYNTYLHEGLPPGPICSPSIASIEAVLNYERHDYYYFVAKEDPTGEGATSHIFSRTYKEHVAANGI